MNDHHQYTRLNSSDLRAIEAQVEAEIAALPPLEDVVKVPWRTKALGTIASAGAIITLAIVEFIKSFGAIVIACLFAGLEYSRVQAGASALGLEYGKSTLIALAIVCANVIHPIYTLRAHTKAHDLFVTRHTVRGVFTNIYNRIFAPSSRRKVDTTHNPTLSASAFIITATTIVLAVYDVLSPLITQLATGQATKPTIILISEFVMGLGLSVGGVLMLQAIAHEIGLQSLSFDTRTPDEIRAEAHAERLAEIARIRERVRLAYMQAKIQDEQRKKSITANGKGSHDFLDPNGEGYPRRNEVGD